MLSHLENSKGMSTIASIHTHAQTYRENSFDYTYPEFRAWALEAGFSSTEAIPLLGSAVAAVAYK